MEDEAGYMRSPLSLCESGIIDQMIDLPPLIDRSLDDALCKTVCHDVARKVDCLSTGILNLLGYGSRSSLVEVGDDYFCAMRSKEEGSCATDSLTGAGNDCYLILEECADQG